MTPLSWGVIANLNEGAEGLTKVGFCQRCAGSMAEE